MTNKDWLTRCEARLRRHMGAEASDEVITDLSWKCLAIERFDTSESPEDAADMELYGGQ